MDCKAWIVIITVFVTLKLSVSLEPDTTAKNVHSPCRVVINEVLVNVPSENFIELAKVCPLGKTSAYNGLRGKVLSAYVPTQNFNDYGDEDNTEAGVEEAPLGSSSLPPGQVRTNSRNPTHREGAAIARIPSPTCNSRNPRCRTKRHTHVRYKRSDSDIQENSHGFYLSYTSRLDMNNKNYGIYLVHLLGKEANRDTTINKLFPDGPLNDGVRKMLIDRTEDFLILTDSTTAGLTDEYDTYIPTGGTKKTVTVTNEQPSADILSASRCEKSDKRMVPESFIASKVTPGLPNQCPFLFPFEFNGKKLMRQTKEMVVNIVLALQNRKGNMQVTAQLKRPALAAAEPLNLGETTIYRIMREYRQGQAFSNDNKKNRQCSVTELNEEHQMMLYNIMTGYYMKNQVPKFYYVLADFIQTVREKQLQEIEADPNSLAAQNLYSCSARSFAKILDKYGYKYGRLQTKDTAIHSPYVIQRRKRYLELKAIYDADPDVNFIFQDETWIDPHARTRFGYQRKLYKDDEERRKWHFNNHKHSRGQRIIVLAAGSKDGFVTCATEVYPISRNKAKADYHSNVNAKKFMKWMDKVMECLPKKKKHVIVFDNCPFHSARDVPKSKDRKEVYLNWIKKKKDENVAGIPENYEKLTLKALKQVVKVIVSEQDQFIIDKRVEEKYGHKIIRLPPYSPELNPIEYVWADLKRHVREKNTAQSTELALRLAKSYMETYTGAQWQAHINHVKRTEEEYRQRDQTFNQLASQNPDLENMPWLDEDQIDTSSGACQYDDFDSDGISDDDSSSESSVA